jgi:hypothetical protein
LGAGSSGEGFEIPKEPSEAQCTKELDEPGHDTSGDIGAGEMRRQ